MRELSPGSSADADRVAGIWTAAEDALRCDPARIRAVIRDRLVEVLQHDVVAIYLHGSRAQGHSRTTSDWDVAVILRGELTDWVAASLRLASLFNECPFAMDLQAFGEAGFREDAGLRGTLPHTIARSGERLYEGADTAAD